MYRKCLPFFLLAETPIHAGSGSEIGIVDLPIQREKHTQFPKIESSGIKGCIREAFEHSQKKVRLEVGENQQEVEAKDKELAELVFGPEEGESHAGSIAFTDAKILLFPVKSLKGVFAWITCPMVFTRFVEDMNLCNKGSRLADLNITANTVTDTSDITIQQGSDIKVVLEEFTFKVEKNSNTQTVAEILSQIIFPKCQVYNFWREKLKKSLLILPDDDFKDFVTTSTEIITRTRISSETGTVQTGALWTEEYLPQDTVLYSIAMTTAARVSADRKGPFKGQTSDDEAGKIMEFFKQGLPEVIHIGGNQTIGKGIARLRIMED